MMKNKKNKKAKYWTISQKFLNFKKPTNKEFKVPKWIEFCEHFISNPNLKMFLYESASTNSKYIYVNFKNKTFKVRFSDHKPNKRSENTQDSDFYVGITNLKITNTEMAKKALADWIQSHSV